MDRQNSDPLRVYLIGCGSKKREAPASARELYTGGLFSMTRRFVEATGAPWFILSAAHYLVKPDQVIEPYDRSLADLDGGQRAGWGEIVIGDLVGELRALGWRPGRGGRAGSPVELVILAGRAYVDPIRDGRLLRSSWSVSEPLAGLGVGHRRGWLSRSLREIAAPAPAPRLDGLGQALLPWAVSL